jgi:hypothetical protein
MKFAIDLACRVRRTDDTRTVEAKQLDDGMVDTFVLIAAMSKVETRLISPGRILVCRMIAGIVLRFGEAQASHLP